MKSKTVEECKKIENLIYYYNNIIEEEVVIEKNKGQAVINSVTGICMIIDKINEIIDVLNKRG